MSEFPRPPHLRADFAADPLIDPATDAAVLALPRGARRENALLVLFRIPVFRRMWAAITFSSLGDWLGLLANTALAQQLTREQSVATQGAAISGVLLVRLTPDLVLGPIAAAFADKLDRRKTVIVGELTASILYASIALGYNLIWLYIAQFTIEAAGLFTQPAKQVIWVAIVPKKLLATANQVSLMSVYGTVPVAAGVFALLSAVNRLISGGVGPHSVNDAIVVALLLNAATFLVSATTVFLSRSQIPVVPRDHEREQGIVSLLREGVSFIRQNSLIRGLYVGVIGAFAAGGLTVGVAQLWVATLDAGTAGYSIMFGTLFTGLALGMLFGPRVLPSFARGRVFGLAIGSAGVTLLIMSLIQNFVLADILAALIGVFAGMAWIIGYTLIGAEVEDRLRGRTFAFVLSSVRIVLLMTIAIGPLVAGLLGSHAIKVGDRSYLRFSGPGLTLLIGGVLALGVSWYAASRTTRSPARVRDVVRRRVLRSGFATSTDHLGLFVSVDGVDAATTAAYAQLVADALTQRRLVLCRTAEPTDSPIGRRVRELLQSTDHGVEPETAALLSAADRAEHVAGVIRPALDRGEVVVCDRFVLTSLALHGGGRGADIDRLSSVNRWGTGGLLPDLTLVVESEHAVARFTGAPPDDVDTLAMAATLADAPDADPDRYLRCAAQVPDTLPAAVVDRLYRLVDYRASLIPSAVPEPVGTDPDAAGDTDPDPDPDDTGESSDAAAGSTAVTPTGTR